MYMCAGMKALHPACVHIIHYDTPSANRSWFARNIVRVDEGAEIILVESYIGDDGVTVQSNSVTRVDVADGGHVEHIKLQQLNRDSLHLSTWLINLGAESRYNGFQYTTGASVSRNQIFVECAGREAEIQINGAFLQNGAQHCDTRLWVNHIEPGCTSRELFKGVLDDTAKGIFQGKLIVKPEAQKTDGKQMAQACCWEMRLSLIPSQNWRFSPMTLPAATGRHLGRSMRIFCSISDPGVSVNAKPKPF